MSIQSGCCSGSSGVVIESTWRVLALTYPRQNFCGPLTLTEAHRNSTILISKLVDNNIATQSNTVSFYYFKRLHSMFRTPEHIVYFQKRLSPPLPRKSSHTKIVILLMSKNLRNKGSKGILIKTIFEHLHLLHNV